MADDLYPKHECQQKDVKPKWNNRDKLIVIILSIPEGVMFRRFRYIINNQKRALKTKRGHWGEVSPQAFSSATGGSEQARTTISSATGSSDLARAAISSATTSVWARERERGRDSCFYVSLCTPLWDVPCIGGRVHFVQPCLSLYVYFLYVFVYFCAVYTHTMTYTTIYIYTLLTHDKTIYRFTQTWCFSFCVLADQFR